MSIEDENTQEPLIERLSATPEPKATSTPNTSSKKKRKRTDDDGAKEVVEDPANKKKKKKKSKKAADGYDDEELDLEAGINKAFSYMDSQLLADYMAQRTRKYESDLSAVELEDKFIAGRFCALSELLQKFALTIDPANVIRDTTSWDKPRTLDNLPLFLEYFCENPRKLWSASKKNGTPHTIIVTAAGLRAADLARYCYWPSLCQVVLTCFQNCAQVPVKGCHSSQAVREAYQDAGLYQFSEEQ